MASASDCFVCGLIRGGLLLHFPLHGLPMKDSVASKCFRMTASRFIQSGVKKLGITSTVLPPLTTTLNWENQGGYGPQSRQRYYLKRKLSTLSAVLLVETSKLRGL